MKRTGFLYLFSWLFFLSLGVFAFFEFYQINIIPYISQQSIWRSLRFPVFIFVSIFFIVFSIVFFILSMKRKVSFENIKKKLLSARLGYLIAGLFIILPFLVNWFFPVHETLKLGFWTGLFIAYCGVLVGTLFLPRHKLLQQNYSRIRMGLSLLLLGFIGYFIFNLAYFRFPLGDDVLGQFVNSSSFLS